MGNNFIRHRYRNPEQCLCGGNIRIVIEHSSSSYRLYIECIYTKIILKDSSTQSW